MTWELVGGIATLLGALAVLAHFFAKGFLPFRRAVLEAWQNLVGVEANHRTGQRQVPSLFERLDTQDETLAKQNEILEAQNKVLETIKHELFPNSGKSLRDDVLQIKKDVDSLHEKLDTDATPKVKKRKP